MAELLSKDTLAATWTWFLQNDSLLLLKGTGGVVIQPGQVNVSRWIGDSSTLYLKLDANTVLPASQ